MSSEDDFERVWQRIGQHAGEEFRQIRGKPFTYTRHEGYVELHTTNQNIPKSYFAEAFAKMPLPNTVPIQHLRGPSYIYAILMDERIRL